MERIHEAYRDFIGSQKRKISTQKLRDKMVKLFANQLREFGPIPALSTIRREQTKVASALENVDILNRMSEIFDNPVAAETATQKPRRRSPTQLSRQQLRDEEKDVLELYQLGMSTVDIGFRLGMTVSHVHYVRSRLRKSGVIGADFFQRPHIQQARQMAKNSRAQDVGLVTVKQLMRRYQVSRSKISAMMRDGTLSPVRIGRSVRFRESDLPVMSEGAVQQQQSAAIRDDSQPVAPSPQATHEPNGGTAAYARRAADNLAAASTAMSELADALDGSRPEVNRSWIKILNPFSRRNHGTETS